MIIAQAVSDNRWIEGEAVEQVGIEVWLVNGASRTPVWPDSVKEQPGTAFDKRASGG